MNSPNFNNRKYTFHKLRVGNVYLFENYILTEFNGGSDINFKNFNEVSLLIKEHFEDRPFGFIANRINSYSINLNDADLFHKDYPNLKAYAIIAYNNLTERIFEFENHFFNFNRKAFKTVEESLEWVETTLKTYN